jgi:serine/threonine protein kinase
LRALFRREIQLARRVTHPNVCRIFDLEQHEDPESGEPVLLRSMELIEGQTLAEYLRVNGPLTFRAALPLIDGTFWLQQHIKLPAHPRSTFHQTRGSARARDPIARITELNYHYDCAPRRLLVGNAHYILGL